MAEFKSYRVMEASIQNSKEGLGGQAMCGKAGVPKAAPEE
jgi:hypothetical protein